MAGEDYIFKSLLRVGLEINEKDRAELKRKLRELGEEFNLDNVTEQTKELSKLFTKLKGDRERLEKAATKGVPLSGLPKNQQGALQASFDRMKTFEKQLGKLANTLNNLGLSTSTPLFNELAGLEHVMQNLQATTRNVAPLIDNVTKSFKANAAATKKAQVDAAKTQRTLLSQERTAETLERARRTRAAQSPEGRKAFLSAARGNTDAVTSAAAAKQGRAFAASALRASERAVQLERDRPVQDPRAIQRAERKLDLSARTYNALDQLAGQLTSVEALNNKQRQLDNLTRSEDRKHPGAKKAAYAALRGDTASIATSEDASKGAAFALKELGARQQIHALTEKVFGESSKEAERTARQLAATEQAYASLIQRVKELAEVEKLGRTNKRKAEQLQQKEASITQDRVNRGRLQRDGRKALDLAGGIDGGADGFTNIDAAKKAEAFVKGELGDLIKLQKAYGNTFGFTSDQAKRAALEVDRYGEFLRKLEGRIQSLGTVAQTQEQIDKHREAVRTSEERRRSKGLELAKGKSLLESANGDFSQLTDRQALTRARTFAKTELQQLRIQQESAARTVGLSSGEYDKARIAADQYANTIRDLDQRLDQLGNKPTRVPVLETFRSSQVHAEGKRVYETARQTDGGVASLTGADAIQAQRYVKAHYNEQIALGKALSKNYADNKHAADAAGEAARNLGKDLDTLNEATRPAASGLNLLQSTLRSFLKYAVGYAALYGLAGAITALARSVADLQAQFLEIQAVTGSTDAQMGRLSQTVFDVAKNSKFSLAELTQAAKVLAQAGVSVDDMNTSLRATANFAAATGSNLEIAADLLSTTRSVFKELSDDVIANQLAKAINISKLTAEDLKTILSLGAQTAKSFGLTSEQFLAAVATLRNAGLKASTTATGLRQSMLEIFSPDLKLTKALQERYSALGERMGAEAVKARFFAFSKGRAPLQAALTELKRLGFNDEGSQSLSRAFDVRSTNAIKAMISNLEELAANESRITFGRAAAEGADTTIKGLNASFTRLLSTISSFTYNRSEGILGFFTELFDGANKAIQKLDEYDLKKRADGEKGLPGAGELLLGGLPRQFAQFAYRNTIGRMFPSEQTAEEAGAQANAQGQLITNEETEFQKYDQAANNWDIKLAELKKNIGSTAESFLMASQTTEDLNSAISNTFGRNLTETNEQILELVKDYTKLAPSERKGSLETLKKQFPELAKLTQGMSFGEADRYLFTIQQLQDTVSGALKGDIDQLNTKLVNARKTLDKLDGAAPSNEQELEAQLFEQIVAQSYALQEILAGTSKEAMDMQRGILLQAADTLAQQMRANGAVNPLDANAKKVSAQFIQRIKAISLGNNQSTAEADMRAAVTAFLAQFKEFDAKAIGHVQEMQGSLFDAANQLGPGLMKRLLMLSIGKLQEKVDVVTEGVVKETADRVKYGTGTLVKTFQNPKFKAYLEQSTDATTGGMQQLYSDIGAGGLPEADVLNNTQRYQLAAEKVKEYNDIQLRQDELIETTTKQRNKELAMEDRRNKAQTAVDDADVNKQFGVQRAALGELIAAEKAIAQQKYDDAKDAMPTDITRDPEKNKALIKEQIDAKHELAKLDEKHAKQLEKINREESKISIQRTEGQKLAEQKRLKGVLDNVTNLTPQETIDAAIQQYDKVNADLLEVFEKRKAHEGELNKLSEAEVDEKRKSLAPYKQQADYLEMIFRRERQARDDIDLMLARALTTGNALNDARLEDKGLAPGNRTQRRDYLLARQGLLTDKRTNAENTLSIAQQEFADLTVKSDADPKNKNISESLKVARAEVHDLTQVIAGANTELGQTELALERVTGTWESGFRRAFDPNVISRSLEQSESSFEHFGDVINDHVVDAIEGIGDAFADAVVEGESLSESLEKVFSQLRKETLRTLIKTLSNEAIGSLTGSIFGSTEHGSQGLLPALFQRLGFGGKPAKSAPTNSPSEPVQSGGFIDNVASTLFGGSTDTEKTDASCLPKETADAMKKVAQSPDLASVVATEGKGFFDSLGSGFVSVLDGVTSGFSKVFGDIGGLFGLASSSGSDQAGGLLSLTTALMGGISGGGGGSATYKGAFGFAGGGIIHGPGSGTSDSIPTYVTGAGGRTRPLALSNGESILTAKATAALGQDFIHSVNSGRMLHARTGAIVSDQASLSASTMAAAASSQSTGSSGGTSVYQVNVTPAQMRMRMGDWLDQQILNERARR